MPVEQLLPSLLDRLTEDAPDRPAQAGRPRTINAAQLRDMVIRDLGWLFNATKLDVTEPLDDYPHVKRSVLNFGLPGLSGKSAGSLDLRLVERELREAILSFEPRLIPHTVVVRAIEGARGNAVGLSIEGQLWALPVPIGLLVQSELDLETGQVTMVAA